MPGHRGRILAPSLFAYSIFVFALVWQAAALAQDARYFSPKYAASDGSPYSDVYARAFGAGGPAAGQAAPGAPEPWDPPLITAAPPPGPPPAESEVVYVIEDGQLSTYSSDDYARGSGAALSQVPLPTAADAPVASGLELPSIADRLYGAPPLETAADKIGGAPGTPVRLIPPQD